MRDKFVHICSTLSRIPVALNPREEAEYSERVLRCIRRSNRNVGALLKLLKELRSSTSRLSPTQFPLATLRAVLTALLAYLGTASAARRKAASGDPAEPAPAHLPPAIHLCVETVLAICQHHGLLEPATASSPSSIPSLLEQSNWGTEALSTFGGYFRSVLEFNAEFAASRTMPPATNIKSRTPESIQASP